MRVPSAERTLKVKPQAGSCLARQDSGADGRFGSRVARLRIALLLVLVAGACSGANDGPATAEPAPSSEASAPREEPDRGAFGTVDGTTAAAGSGTLDGVDGTTSAAGLGTLEGFVRFSGEVLPQPTRVQNSTDPAICGLEQNLEDLVVSAQDRGIKNVIVALEGVAPETIPPYPPRQLVLENRQCRFVPHVSVLTSGSTIVATNRDSVLHTEHYYGALRANAALPLEGVTVTTRAASAGMIIVKCDVHGWMQAFIRVDVHPFHDVTRVNGYFRIANVPAGTYRLEIWHERLGTQEKTIRIAVGETQAIQVTYSGDNG